MLKAGLDPHKWRRRPSLPYLLVSPGPLREGSQVLWNLFSYVRSPSCQLPCPVIIVPKLNSHRWAACLQAADYSAGNAGMSTHLCSLPPSAMPFDHWGLRLAEWDDRIEMLQRNEVADGLLFHFI